jgi:Flp pilus assembly protein TadG
MKCGRSLTVMHHASPRGLGFLEAGGSATVEFAIASFFLIVLALGIADFGMLFNNYQALAGATRIGAAYARDSTTCRNSATGINTLASPPTVGAACITGIQNAIAHSIYFSPAPGYPTSCAGTTSWPAVICECDDGTAITCGQSCAAQSPPRPAPNRAFVAVCASQAFTPLTPWPALTLNSIAELRIQ